MKFLSLFAGIGGFDLGLTRTNHACIGTIELDSFCNRVLNRRFPHVARWPDVREWQGYGNESFDLLVGGFPCQGASIAGKRLGLADDRTALFWEIIRIAKETTPTWGLFENVPGLFSVTGGADFPLVITTLQTCWPIVGWRVLDSRFFNVAQRRERIFFVCGPTEKGVSQVLFEPESCRGYFAPSGETGEKVAGVLGSGSASTRLNFDGNYVVSHPLTGKPYADNEAQHRKLIVAAALTSSTGGADDNDAQGNHLITHALTSGGFDASEDGTGRGTPLVFQPKTSSTQSMNPHPLAPSLGTTKEGGVVGAMGVRRLTVIECERLQGFPDGWTCLCQPIEAYAEDPDEAHLRCTCADSPRYRALGNAVTVPVLEWLGKRLQEAA